MAKFGLADMITICHHFSHLFLFLFVLFLFLDVYLFIRLDIRNLAGYLTGRTDKKVAGHFRSMSKSRKGK